MKQWIFTYLFLFLVYISGTSYAQGCSDAGVCSIGNLGSGDHGSTAKHRISVSETFGLSDTKGELTYIFSSGLESSFQIFPGTNIAFKISHQIATGKLATTTGFGNIIGSVSQTLYRKPGVEASINIGTAIPSNKSNLRKDGRGLPMEYQSSLGSYEILGGFNLVIRDWKFSLGYQHPFQRNENEFLHSDWLENSHAQNYFESNQLKRGDDLFLRIEKAFQLKNSKIYVGMLPIFRIEEDEIIKNGEPMPLNGSNQLTLNVNFTYERKIRDDLNLQLLIGNPVIAREIRADGLTRVVVLAVSISYNF
jgi:hypothetical protein